MRDDDVKTGTQAATEAPFSWLNAVARSRVLPPPMLVVHKGWFGDRVTKRPADELFREGLARSRQG